MNRNINKNLKIVCVGACLVAQWQNLPTNPGDMDITRSLVTEQLKSMCHIYWACARAWEPDC